MTRILFLFSLVSTGLIAQSFQSTSNPYYWKNKTASKSEYWQQDIDYTIDAYLNEKDEIIKGTEKIVYTNNSPHSLTHLFFNLYQNAFIKNSYLSNLQEANGEKIKYGKWEEEGKGNEILSIKVNGEKVKTEIDGSIMKTWLQQPMAPNTKITIEIAFNTYYSKGGVTRRRMKTFLHQKEKHFNGAHWYPRLAVYDRKFGWCTDQHLNREFYGDFGTYNVSLNMPANFVVEATGVLQNRKEVLPETLRKQLDLSNFWTRKYDTAVTFFIPMKKGERKVWKYLGENVHDFAWIAGPHYRIDEKQYKGYSTVAMVLEPHASGWKNACDYTHKVIEVYGKDFGRYAYPKMVVADCQDGMEYPMLTMDGGSDPGYRGLLAHEVGHNWFYGMVNNNETYRAMLDEGFTQFLTVWALEAIDGKEIFQTAPTHPYLKEHYEETHVREARAYNSFMGYAMNHDHTEINVHSDGFSGATGQGGGYGNVYNKTATMLFNLQYVLGDSLFTNAMKHYFNQWSFRHPYVEDFRNSIIEYTKVDLNWFFDQWIETSKVIDYKIYPLKKLENGKFLLRLKRNAEMQMPLDITVTGRSGKSYNFYIPNTWFEKKTDAKVLPRWIGWDTKLKTEYQTIIDLPEPPYNAFIDTSGRLADINERNNATIKPVTIKFDSKTDRPLDRRNYSILWRPDVWYNNFDGIKLGIHTEGKYFRNVDQFNFDFWVNTGIGKWSVRPDANPFRVNSQNDIISFRFNYQTPTPLFIPRSTVRVDARHLDGVAMGQLRITKEVGDFWTLRLSNKFIWRRSVDQFNYDYSPYTTWDLGTNNSLIVDAQFSKNFSSQWRQVTQFRLRNTLFGEKQYSYAELEHKQSLYTKYIQVKNRVYGRLGANQAMSAKESMLNAGGANGEEMAENKYMRSVTAFPELFTQAAFIQNNSVFSSLQYGGGLNLRGYSFREVITDANGHNFSLMNQNTGYAFNTQINFEKLSPLKIKVIRDIFEMNTYLFGDIGQLGMHQVKDLRFNLSHWIYDAGVGTSITMKKFWVLSGIRPLTFRFDMPLYLSHPAINDNNENFKFRWLIGVDQAF